MREKSSVLLFDVFSLWGVCTFGIRTGRLSSAECIPPALVVNVRELTMYVVMRMSAVYM